MERILIILEKEWRELRHERGLIASSLAFPLLLTAISIVVVFALGRVPDEETGELGAALADPALAGLPIDQLGQAIMGRQFGLLFLMMPLVVPTVLAAYSIVGEKTRRTLEPLLATPIATWELLLGKSLAALIPATVITWFCAALFVCGVALGALTPQIFALIISPEWLLMLLVWSPLLALLAIALSVLVSARVNDPRTAQQISGVVIIPVMGLFFGQLAGAIVVSAAFVAGVSLALLVIDALAIRLAVLVFQRERILTRWT